MVSNLFSEFPEISTQQWKQKIQFELEGEPYEKLLRHSVGNISIKPFYDPSDRSGFSIPVTPLQQYCFQKLILKKGESVKFHLSAISPYSEALLLIVQDPSIDLPLILEGIPLAKTPIHIEFTRFSNFQLKELAVFLATKDHHVRFGIDPIGKLVETGNWLRNEKKDFEELKKLGQRYPELFHFSIYAHHYSNATASTTQQLAYTLAHANEYLNIWQDLADPKPPFVFCISQGEDFFIEVAKLKALRILFKLLAREYNHPEEITILTSPGFRNKSTLNPALNRYRSNLEAFSGFLGGADGLTNDTLSPIYQENSMEWQNGLDLPQLQKLKKQSHHRLGDPTQGTYFIEELTRQVCTNTLRIFKSIEKGGGFLQQLRTGKIQQKIKESNAEELQRLKKGEKVFLHPSGTPLKPLKKMTYSKRGRTGQKTLIAPIFPKKVVE